jgi:hypothetical protein
VKGVVLGMKLSGMILLPLDFELGLWRLHTMAVQVERLWDFMAKGLDFGLGLSGLHTMPG